MPYTTLLLLLFIDWSIGQPEKHNTTIFMVNCRPIGYAHQMSFKHCYFTTNSRSDIFFSQPVLCVCLHKAFKQKIKKKVVDRIHSKFVNFIPKTKNPPKFRTIKCRRKRSLPMVSVTQQATESMLYIVEIAFRFRASEQKETKHFPCFAV